MKNLTTILSLHIPGASGFPDGMVWLRWGHAWPPLSLQRSSVLKCVLILSMRFIAGLLRGLGRGDARKRRSGQRRLETSKLNKN